MSIASWASLICCTMRLPAWNLPTRGWSVSHSTWNPKSGFLRHACSACMPAAHRKQRRLHLPKEVFPHGRLSVNSQWI